MVDDFEFAAQRFSKDQSKRRTTAGRTTNSRLGGTGSRVGRNTTSRGGGGIVLSEKAKREAEQRKQQQEKLAQEKLRLKQQSVQQKQFFKSIEQTLGVQQLTRTGLPLQLQATSIYGKGDKIALPPSVLELITNTIDTDDDDGGMMNGLSPWFFRIAIPNPNYTFPSSPLLQSYQKKDNVADDDDDHDVSMEDDDDDDDEHKESEQIKLKRQIYLDELRYKYLSYTHGTVVEFTQDEGYVGLPKPICDALLLINTNNNNNQQPSDDPTNPNITTMTIPITRTVDPALINKKVDDDNNNNNNTEIVDNDNTVMDIEESADPSSGTPGHVAYNAFDIPALPIEITLMRNIPKGKSCTLVPDITALQNGFYKLPDIKLVLEQSLIRTRATLSINDTILTWHRGKQYTLHVKDVAPCDTYTAISCINTDIEIEFGEVPSSSTTDETATTTTSNTQSTTSSSSKTENKSFFPSSGGYTLGGSSSNNNETTTLPQAATTTIPTTTTSTITNDLLLPEPPVEQKENIVTIQIRGTGIPSNLRRRFDITVATVQDLYNFVTISSTTNTTNFQLVTRFPRKILSLDTQSQTTTLIEAGIQTGNELLLIEPL